MEDFEISEIDIKQRPSSVLPRSIKVGPEVATTPLPQGKQSAAVQEKWNGFVESSTLHGLQHVFGGRTLARRVIWALFLLLGIGWFSLQTQKLLTKYFSYPVTTKVTLVYEDNPEFPAVSICNFNMFRRSVVREAGYEKILNYVLRKSSGIDVSGETINWELYESINLTEFHFAMGHQIYNTLHQCYWDGGLCTYENFTPVLTSMGLCYTFNSGKDGQPILRVRQAGSDFALHLMLDVQQWDYGALGSRAGLMVFIHDHETPPLVAQLGFAVGPGTSTFAAINKQKTISLPDPYESNCLDKNDSKVPGYKTYTILGCLLMCQTKYIIEKCGCRDVGMPAINDTRMCKALDLSDCVLREKGNFRKLKDQQCECPVPCSTTSFRPILSYAAFPSDEYIKQSHELYEIYGSNTSEASLDFIQGYMSQNMLELVIYFEELSYHVIEQTPAYDSESLFAEIGGQVGLCVGASLLTVLEFCDVIIAIIGIRFGFR
ncbi:hypothetical protein pdam_00001790 [Pocillopora damicornis]|uniref:Uncharacterized protein n=1 Tax=Pocillopora damicornis TaxID=46731 RepID=A0A3M6TNS0_POCDA|nr:acid-sensing ion channel 1-like [Pocillopora damicornis]RMX43030.1 hypothetical protein pdam_00001790 [Pocillopora damicornis]